MPDVERDNAVLAGARDAANSSPDDWGYVICRVCNGYVHRLEAVLDMVTDTWVCLLCQEEE
jgi:hypothetical protein